LNPGQESRAPPLDGFAVVARLDVGLGDDKGAATAGQGDGKELLAGACLPQAGHRDFKVHRALNGLSEAGDQREAPEGGLRVVSISAGYTVAVVV
jgi:hypothetical protein